MSQFTRIENHATWNTFPQYKHNETGIVIVRDLATNTAGHKWFSEVDGKEIFGSTKWEALDKVLSLS